MYVHSSSASLAVLRVNIPLVNFDLIYAVDTPRSTTSALKSNLSWRESVLCGRSKSSPLMY